MCQATYFMTIACFLLHFLFIRLKKKILLQCHFARGSEITYFVKIEICIFNELEYLNLYNN